MTCLFCFWQPYRGNVVATTHDPPLVFPKPQRAALCLMLITENQPATMKPGHHLMAGTDDLTGLFQPQRLYDSIQSTQPENTICWQQIVGSQ